MLAKSVYCFIYVAYVQFIPRRLMPLYKIILILSARSPNKPDSLEISANAPP